GSLYQRFFNDRNNREDKELKWLEFAPYAAKVARSETVSATPTTKPNAHGVRICSGLKATLTVKLNAPWYAQIASIQDGFKKSLDV
ncbi:MAG TPA: hypothetical protein VMR88_02835, partial [Candidatus Polarisedimenticolaceae bacterium]|nr:hypothetical protein [Candidatus Polarisedimenticolaceae bacterium]